MRPAHANTFLTKLNPAGTALLYSTYVGGNGHSNVGLTMNVYVKSVAESQVAAMDAFGARLEKETCNDLATGGNGLVN